MTHPLRAAFQEQSTACAGLGSPFMGQLCRVLGERLQPGTPLNDRLFGWAGELGPRGDSVPLRLCGALHAVRLQGDATLMAHYPPHTIDDDALWDAISTTLITHSDFIDDFINSAPQTNEVRRATALIAAAHVIAAVAPNPMRVSELGASAGLNLNWDRFALKAGGTRFGPSDAALTLTPDWSGPLPPRAALRVIERRGVDLNPVDPVTDHLRLLSYLWPDQPERLDLTESALSQPPAPVDRGDAIDWLAPRLPHIAGQTHMIYTTIAWQYFPTDKQAAGLKMIEAAGATATPDTPLAFVQMENDGGPHGAALRLRMWPGDIDAALGRVDFHGRWVEWAG